MRFPSTLAPVLPFAAALVACSQEPAPATPDAEPAPATDVAPATPEPAPEAAADPAPEGQPADGDTVLLSGTVSLGEGLEAEGTLQLEITSGGEDERSLVGRYALSGPGPFSQAVPKDIGPVEVGVFFDLNNDGPGEGEPTSEPVELTIAADAIDGLEFELATKPPEGDEPKDQNPG